MNNVGTQKYMFATGDSAEYRLNLVNNILSQYSIQFLANSHIKSGMHIADIGCGTGNMLPCLSRMVGVGKVYAIDKNAEQLEVVSEKIKKLKLKNVEIIQDDIQNLGNFNKKVDLVYSRLLLVHTTNPQLALNQISSLLKINGIFISEEMAVNTGICFPHSDSYNLSRKLFCGLAKKMDLDFEIGSKLVNILLSMEMHLLETRSIQRFLRTKPERQMIWLSLQECTRKLIENKLCTENELNLLISKLKEIATDRKYSIALPILTQIIAKKQGKFK